MLQTEDVTPINLHQYCADASDFRGRFGFELGKWPQQIPTKMGNGMPFIKKKMVWTEDDDLAYVIYDQANGCIELRVYNT